MGFSVFRDVARTETDELVQWLLLDGWMRGLDDEVKMCRRATLAVFDRFLSEKSKLSI